MTDFDFAVAFLLTMVCGYHQNSSVLSTLNEIAQPIRIIEINESILETASILSIHPPDGVRVAAAAEHGLDGIVTWDFTHFQSQQDISVEINVSGTTVRYVNTTENCDSSEDGSIELDIYSVNEFFIHQANQSEEAQASQAGNNKVFPSRPKLFKIQYEGRISDWQANWTWVSVEIQVGENQYISEEADGVEGLVHTVFKAINFCLSKHLSNLVPFEATITVPPLPKTAGLGEVVIELTFEEQKAIGKSYQSDFVFATATAYLDAVTDLLIVYHG